MADTIAAGPAGREARGPRAGRAGLSAAGAGRRAPAMRRMGTRAQACATAGAGGGREPRPARAPGEGAATGGRRGRPGERRRGTAGAAVRRPAPSPDRLGDSFPARPRPRLHPRGGVPHPRRGTARDPARALGRPSSPGHAGPVWAADAASPGLAVPAAEAGRKGDVGPFAGGDRTAADVVPELRAAQPARRLALPRVHAARRRRRPQRARRADGRRGPLPDAAPARPGSVKEVWLAHDLTLDRPVALSRVKGAGRGGAERVRREAG